MGNNCINVTDIEGSVKQRMNQAAEDAIDNVGNKLADKLKDKAVEFAEEKVDEAIVKVEDTIKEKMSAPDPKLIIEEEVQPEIEIKEPVPEENVPSPEVVPDSEKASSPKDEAVEEEEE